jgi:hypothetical protein
MGLQIQHKTGGFGNPLGAIEKKPDVEDTTF